MKTLGSSFRSFGRISAAVCLPFLLSGPLTSLPAQAADKAGVQIVMWTAPKVLVVGQKAVLHVKYTAKAALKNPVMVVRPPNETWFTITPRYRILPSGMAEPEPGGMKPEGFPDKGTKKDETRPPPALGEVPTALYDVTPHRAGSAFLRVELYHAGGLARGALRLKVVKK